jgi:hypothetical protein
MKKLFIVLAVFLIAGAGAFADVTVSGGAAGGFQLGFSPLSATGKLYQAEINLNAAVTDNTSVSIQLDNAEATPFDSDVIIDDFRISSNIFGELGLDLPVSLAVTFGYFDTYMCNFQNVNTSWWVYGGGWAGTNMRYLLATQPDTDLAWEWTLGISDFALRFWNDFGFQQMAVSFGGSVSIVSFIAGYANTLSDASDSGTIWAEVGANLDLGAATLFIPVNVAIGLPTSGVTFGWNTGVKAVIIDMITVQVGVGGDTATTAFQFIVPEVHAAPIAGLDVYALAWIDLFGGNFRSIDLGVSYSAGALTLNPGIVIGIDSAYYSDLGQTGGDWGVVGTGFYMLMSVSF